MSTTFALQDRVLDVYFATYEDPGDCYDSPTVEMARALNDLAGLDAIECPLVKGTQCELVFYDADDSDSYGYIVAVRPANPVGWLRAGVQVSSTWQAADNALDRRESGQGWYDLSASGMRKALDAVIAEANAMVPYLAALSNA